MKFKILVYLFLFVCIVLFYHVFNTNKILNYQDDLIQNGYQSNQQLKINLKNIESYCDTNDYFSLGGNPRLDGLTDVVNEEQSLKEQLLKMNTNGGLNRIIILPKERFLIDQIRVVNKYWVLIGFQSNLSWGQAIIEFKEDKDGSYVLKELKSFVNPL